MDWYYIYGKMQVGPVTDEVIAGLIGSGTVRPSTPVWREGMEDWLTAERTELASKFIAQAEPRPPPYRKQLQKAVQQEPPAEGKGPLLNRSDWRIILGLILFIGGIVGFFTGFLPSLVAAGLGVMIMAGWIGGR
jgi:hypothetical protein